MKYLVCWMFILSAACLEYHVSYAATQALFAGGAEKPCANPNYAASTSPLSLALPAEGGRIIGVVIDSLTKQPVEFATVSIFPSGSRKPIDGGTTDKKGAFKLSNVPEGSYYISVSFIGYKETKRSNITIGPNANTVNLGLIKLSSSAVAIKGITITAQRPLVENKIDKLVFNADQDISSQSGAATDVLRKVPQVSVDADGNVELRGSNDIRVLINGKPSTIMATSLADALQSIPGNQIKTIEVITSPSAKYDAEGGGGIINIILKKSTAKGFSGTVNATAGSRNQNGTLNLSARKGSFGVNFGLSGNAIIPSTSYTNSFRRSVDSLMRTTLLSQNGVGKLRRNGYDATLGLEWDITKKDNISSNVKYNYFGFFTKTPTDQRTEITDDMGNVVASSPNFLPQIRRLVDANFGVRGIDWSTDYKRVFNDAGQSIDFSYQLSFNRNINNYSQTGFPSFTATEPYTGQQDNNTGKTREQNIQLDYVQPFSKTTKLELGAKATLRYISSNVDANSLDSMNHFVANLSQSSRFTFLQNFFSAYALLSWKAFNYLDMYTGMRIEHTNQHSPAGDKDYNSYIPTLTISRTIDDKNSLKLAYSQRVRRPGLRDVNPFINVSDPTNITTGNPDLNAELTKTAELTYSLFIGKGSTLNIAGYYRYSGNDIQNYTSIRPSLQVGDSTYHNVAYTSPQNIGRQTVWGLNLFGAVPLTPDLSLRGNANFTQNIFEDKTGLNPRNSSFNYKLNLNASYNITPTLAAEAFGMFNSPKRTIQGKNPSFSMYNLGIRKQLFKKKGSIAFVATSPFNHYRNLKTDISSPTRTIDGQTFYGFQSSNERKVPLQSFGINFSYQFGNMNYGNNKKKGKGRSGGDKPGGDDQGGGDDPIGDLSGAVGTGTGNASGAGSGGAGGGEVGNRRGQHTPQTDTTKQSIPKADTSTKTLPKADTSIKKHSDFTSADHGVPISYMLNNVRGFSMFHYSFKLESRP